MDKPGKIIPGLRTGECRSFAELFHCKLRLHLLI